MHVAATRPGRRRAENPKPNHGGAWGCLRRPTTRRGTRGGAEGRRVREIYRVRREASLGRRDKGEGRKVGAGKRVREETKGKGSHMWGEEGVRQAGF